MHIPIPSVPLQVIDQWPIQGRSHAKQFPE